MSVEAYTVQFDKKNYQRPIPQGENVEEVLRRREDGIRENIIKYLGEYRLGVKYDEVFYKEERDGVTGETFLSSLHGEKGPILNIFRKAIYEKERRGLSTRREVAECLGFQKLQEGLKNSPDNSLLLWVSPPGLPEEGYGMYSFTFVGQLLRDKAAGQRTIRMIPYRNILSKEEHRTYLRYFTHDTDRYKKDTDFLANPVIIPQNEFVRNPEDILRLIGEHERFNTDWQRKLSKEIGSLIDGYIQLVKKGASDKELIKARNAIEKYTIAIGQSLIEERKEVNLKDTEMKDVALMFDEWGRTAPPAVGGSCGSTGSTLMEYQQEHNKPWEYHTGDCVVCHTKSVDVGPCGMCKNCENKFDQEAVSQAA